MRLRRCELQNIHALDVAILSVFMIGIFLIPIMQLTAGSFSVNRRKGVNLRKSLRKSRKNGLANRAAQSDNQKWTVVRW